MSEQYVTVYMKLDELRTDPVQYKPYSPALNVDWENFPIYVAIALDSDYLEENSQYHQKEDLPDNAIVITLEGLTDVMGQIAMAIRNRLENKS